jgi:macrolide transport system ATP-binding/permease protein
LEAAKKLFKTPETAVGRSLLVSSGDAAGMGGVPVALPFTVVGVVESASQLGFSFGDDRLYVPDKTFRTKLDARATMGAFAVNLERDAEPQQVVAQIKHRLRALRGSEDFSMWVGDEAFQKMQTFNAAFAALLAGVGAIALLVGGVGVMNIMLVSVSERTREIGIRMAVGARQGDVRLQFLIEAVVLCCLGGLVGVALSWLAAQALNAAQQTLHVSVSWQALAVAFGVSSTVGLVFGTVPARRAAALSPVDALARE